MANVPARGITVHVGETEIRFSRGRIGWSFVSWRDAEGKEPRPVVETYRRLAFTELGDAVCYYRRELEGHWTPGATSSS